MTFGSFRDVKNNRKMPIDHLIDDMVKEIAGLLKTGVKPRDGYHRCRIPV